MESCLQVGNLTRDIEFWGPPENMTAETMKRPAYVIRTSDGASDIAGKSRSPCSCDPFILGSDASRSVNDQCGLSVVFQIRLQSILKAL